MGFEKVLKATIKTLEHLSTAAENRAQKGQHVHQQQQQQQPLQQQQLQQQARPFAPESSSGPHQAVFSRVVYPSQYDGKLVYPPYNEQGDHLFDFSGAGYNEGYTDLPDTRTIPIVLSLDPIPGNADDSSRIQAAIQQLSNYPLVNGFRGILQLNRGTFHVARPLEITSSGVILQGDPAGGTIIVATTDPLDSNALIKIAGQPNAMGKGRIPIVDAAIPVGHNQVRIRDRNRIKVGDWVVVAVAFNAAWIAAVGMETIMRNGKNNGWKPGRFEHHRRVIGVDEDGTLLTLNEPLTTRLESQYGGGFVQSYVSQRVQRVGVQYLEFVFPANENRGPEEIMAHQKKAVKDYRFADEVFNHLLFAMDHAENCWIRDVRSVWWRNFVRVGTNTVAVTFQRCIHTFPQKPPVNAKKGYPLAGQFAFEISGQLILIEHCHVEFSFHAYSYKGRVPGPNVVYQSSCIAKNGDVGPHMKWSTGQLYDNCNIEGQMIIQDRFDAGTGHGWSGANSVVWNTVAHSGMLIQKPPGAQNFQIGCSSKRSKPRVAGHEWAWEESPDCKVSPISLYMAQLAERRQRPRV